MRANIWFKLGATSTTFHPELHRDTLPSPMGMGYRVSVGQGSKSVKPSPIILGQPLQDDLGGIGLWSTPMDFTKFLAALLKGGQPLLTETSVDVLFKPQLGNASRTAMPKLLGGQMRRILGIKSVDDSEQADHCLAGTITLKDIPGRRRRGTVSWSGLPNLHWVRSIPCQRTLVSASNARSSNQLFSHSGSISRLALRLLCSRSSCRRGMLPTLVC